MSLRESCRCMSIEAKDLYASNHRVLDENSCYEIRRQDGTLNLKKFTNTFDWSLDAMKLCEVYEKRMRRKDFAVRYGKHLYTTNVICVTFKYSYKEFNMAGKNVFVRNGYVYKDCTIMDGSCVIDGLLVAIQTNVEIKNPLGPDVLGPNFVYENGYYKQVGTIPTIIDKGGLREYLYKNGFMCDGIEYVRYKRSSGSSRVGKCLFVNKALYDDMLKWDKCGLNIVDGQQIDLAAWEAYISLPMSSIIDTIDIPLDSILVIDDYESVFDDEVIIVDNKSGHLDSHQGTATIKNSIFDGQSLMDVSLFGKYKDKGMLLLRNRFFKSCCFNTNIQKWFADNGITSVKQLNGFTLAKSIEDVKLITTPSSIKYAKFGPIEQWLNTVDPSFGVVKYEKKTHKFDGRMVQAHYQLFNTLQLSYSDMEKILSPAIEFISAIRSDPAVLRYKIKYPDEEDPEEWGALDSKNDIVYKMLGINDEFCKTKLYHDFRDDIVRGEIRNLKRGHVLVNGNYSTLMGNGLEMLKASIGAFDGTSEMGIGNIHTKRFAYGNRLLCSRSPHVTVGNILLANNVPNDEIDRYFNLTTEIVCVNAIGENIQQRLNGCDYDSDTMLITDDKLLVDVAERNYSIFKVPTSLISAKKTTRYYTQENKADLDIKTSVNKVGEIINLSQQLQSLMWDSINKGKSVQDVMPLYCDICKLAVLSGVAIDSAKKEFDINQTSEIKVLKERYKITDDKKAVKPMFFKMITTENGYALSDNVKYCYYDTPMDYLQQIISKVNFRFGHADKLELVPFMSIVKEPDIYTRHSFYYAQKDRIIEAIRGAHEERKRLFIDYDLMTKEERANVIRMSNELRQECIEEVMKISNSQATMYLVLKELDKKETRDVSRFVFEVLFGRPDQEFFKLIRQSKSDIYILDEIDCGELTYYGFNFTKKKYIRSSQSDDDS